MDRINLVILIILLTMVSCSTYKEVQCINDNNTIRLIPKTSPFKSYIKERENSIKITSEGLMEIIGQTGVEVETIRKVQEQIEKLNQANITLKLKLEALWNGLIADPCDKTIHSNYMQTVSRIDEDLNEIKKLEILVNRQITSNGLGGTYLEELVDYIDNFNSKSYIN